MIFPLGSVMTKFQYTLSLILPVPTLAALKLNWTQLSSVNAAPWGYPVIHTSNDRTSKSTLDKGASSTVIVKLAVALFPDSSVAVHVMVLGPISKKSSTWKVVFHWVDVIWTSSFQVKSKYSGSAPVIPEL